MDAGADTWEQQQVKPSTWSQLEDLLASATQDDEQKKRVRAYAKEVRRRGLGKWKTAYTEAPQRDEAWEDNLDEGWDDMQVRLELQLRANPLDHEKKPFSEKTAKTVITDNKTSDGTPITIRWVPASADDGGKPKQNSDHLMSCLKLWDWELPNMVLIVHGGSNHPYHMIRSKQLADQRTDFLKSRPRFNDTYFDGQRDPAQGWMNAGTAWRYPAFYGASQDQHEFTFRPSHTLYIDARLQVQDDGEAELIDVGDRTVNEWIMDAVTHQPLGRQAAIKGPGPPGTSGVFYWDINAPSLPLRNDALGGVVYEPDLITSYEEWIGSTRRGPRAPGDPYSFLMGTTQRKYIDKWEKFCAKVKIKAEQDELDAFDRKLVQGELRIELSQLKLSKLGHAKFLSLAPLASQETEDPRTSFVGGFISGVVAAMDLNPDQSYVLIKLQVPGYDEMVSDPVRMSRGPVPKNTQKFTFSKRLVAQNTDNEDGINRYEELVAMLSSKSAYDSLLKISIVLATSDGAEVDNAEIGTFQISLKEMIQDYPISGSHAHEVDGGMGVDLMGQPPPKKPKKDNAKKRSALVSPAPEAMLSQRRSTVRASGSFEASARASESGGDNSAERSHWETARHASPAELRRAASSMGSSTRLLGDKAEVQKPVVMGRLTGRVAFRPPHEHKISGGAKVRTSEGTSDGGDQAPPGAEKADAGEELLDRLGDVVRSARRNSVLPGGLPQMPSSAGGASSTSGVTEQAACGSDAQTPSTAAGQDPSGMSRLPSLPSIVHFPPTPGAPQSDLGLDSGAGVLTAGGATPYSASTVALQLRPPATAGSSPDVLTGEAVATKSPGYDGNGSTASHCSDEDAQGSADDGGDPLGTGGRKFRLISTAMREGIPEKKSRLYTVAHWILWRTVESVGDQVLMFGDSRNQPALVRGNKLGVLANNTFNATEYDPRWAGDNWQLLVVSNDGAYSKFYVGYPSDDETGQPQAARALEPMPGRAVSDVKTEMPCDGAFLKLNTAGRGAGFISQAWIWPRDLSSDEVRELWVCTKGRYPQATRGVPSTGLGRMPYRPPPNPFANTDTMLERGPGDGRRLPSQNGAGGTEGGGSCGGSPVVGMGTKARPIKMAKLPSINRSGGAGGGPPGGTPGGFQGDTQDKAVRASIIEKDVDRMLEVPLVNQLAFQRLLNVFTVLIDFAVYSNSFIVVDRIQNKSCTAELMLDIALRKNPPSEKLVVLVLDCKARLEKANHKLKELKRANFLRKGVSLAASEFQDASLRQLVTPAGMTWLKASTAELEHVKRELAERPGGRDLDAEHVRDIFELYGDGDDLQRDGRPRQEIIWKNFYEATLFASGTHYIVFDHVDSKGRSLLSTLGTVGTTFMSGSTFEHAKIVDTIQSGAPLLLLESTGGVTQAFAHVMKAVRLFRQKWPVDKVLRLITDYKTRAANERLNKSGVVGAKAEAAASKRIYEVENIELLDRELARIDLLLSSDENKERWANKFGLPEMLMLFEKWQRSPDFLMKQIQNADVMKKNAEGLLDLFTSCFSSSAGGVPELGLGNAEIKVVSTAWNRHLLLYLNGNKYNTRSWIMQGVLYLVAFTSTSLAIFLENFPQLKAITFLESGLMLGLPIVAALLGTIGTRLRQRQKYAACKMASYEIVSEIYKYRVRALEYDATQLAAKLAGGGDDSKKKKGDEEEIAKPISAKERDRVARNLFVERVKTIYTTSLARELSSGTAISHVSRWVKLDPARLLVESDDGQKEIREALRGHVAEKLYFIKVREWEIGTEVVKENRARLARQASARRKARLRGMGKQIYFAGVGGLVKLASSSEARILGVWERIRVWNKVRRGEMQPQERYKSKPEEVDEEAGMGAAKRKSRLQKLRHYFVDAGVHSTAEEFVVDEEKVDTLDETHAALDEDDEGDSGDGGGGVMLSDNFMSPLSIDAYFRYRARPLCTYFERTAPWRAFEMQFLEILIFVFNAMGTVLVGAKITAYVPLTVALAAIIASFMDFTNISKQVEAYNTALRNVHNLMNEWDGLTRTERRTRKTITKVVGTVETAMLDVAVAITNGKLTGAAQEEDDGGDKEEEKDK